MSLQFQEADIHLVPKGPQKPLFATSLSNPRPEPTTKRASDRSMIHKMSLSNFIRLLLLLACLVLSDPAAAAVVVVSTRAAAATTTRAAQGTIYAGLIIIRNDTEVLPANPIDHSDDDASTYNPTFAVLTPLIFFGSFIALIGLLVLAYLGAQQIFQRHFGEAYEMIVVEADADEVMDGESVEESFERRAIDVDDWLAAAATDIELTNLEMDAAGGEGKERNSWAPGDAGTIEGGAFRCVITPADDEDSSDEDTRT
ncbi:hypothetical protein BJ508DRAFT_329626 [Ascobolus immersus RN42]|uniref:Uncharacterized protein n=1 Tax=Ascobolus immersus RN42 TaxID=1160509 RepID=A0A3N4I1K7_ASCIM|nr:hypothetical protein BJ508DRAFT_329626 [Ascobolus immersus RN42]